MQLTQDFIRVAARKDPEWSEVSLSRTARLAHRLRMILAAASEDRIKLLSKKYPDVPEEHVRRLADADPSNGKYLEWLLRNYQFLVFAQHDPVTDEITTDISSVGAITETLKFFQKISQSPKLMETVGLDPEAKDINKVSYSDLLFLWFEWRDKDLESERKKRERAKQEGARLIYNQGGYKVIQVGGPGTDEELAPIAACIYGKNTKWCTSNENTAKSYLRRGPLYVVIKDGQNVMQTNLKQFQDPENEPMKVIDNPELSKVLVESGVIADPRTAWDAFQTFGVMRRWLAVEPILAQSPMTALEYARWFPMRFHLGEKVIAQDAEASFMYALMVLHGRFPEGEDAIRQDPQKWEFYEKYMDQHADTGSVKDR